MNNSIPLRFWDIKVFVAFIFQIIIIQQPANTHFIACILIMHGPLVNDTKLTWLAAHFATIMIHNLHYVSAKNMEKSSFKMCSK